MSDTPEASEALMLRGARLVREGREMTQVEGSEARPKLDREGFEALHFWLSAKLQQLQQVELARTLLKEQISEAQALYRDELERVGLELAKREGKKTIPLTSGGVVRMRSTMKGCLDVVDEDEALTWAREHLPKAIVGKAKLSGLSPAQRDALQFLIDDGILRKEQMFYEENLSLTPLKEHFQATGEIPTGCEERPVRQKMFTIIGGKDVPMIQEKAG